MPSQCISSCILYTSKKSRLVCLHTTFHIPYLCGELKNEGLRNNNTTLLNDISEVTLIDDFTVEISIDKDIEFELDDAIHINEIVDEIGKGEKLFHLTIYGDRTVPTKEARSYSISQSGSRLKIAEAIVVQSLSQKMVFNFMINVERPLARTKLFTDVQAAQDWLKSISN